MIFIELDVHLFGQAGSVGLDLKADRQNHHVEGFLLHGAGLIGKFDDQVAGVRNFVDRMDTGLDESNSLFVFGPVEVFFIILAECPHVHVENGTIQIAVGMFFGNHGFLDGVHAADRRAVAIAAAVLVPGSDTLQPRYFLGLLPIQRPHEVSKIRTGST